MEVTKIGNEFLVNTEGEGAQFDPKVTGLANGGFVVTWQTNDGTQDGDSKAIKAQVFDAEGTPRGTEFLVNTQTTGGQQQPEVTGLADGGFVVTWFTSDTTQDGDSYAIKAQVFDAEGVPQGAEFLENTEATAIQYLSAVAGVSGGGGSWRPGRQRTRPRMAIAPRSRRRSSARAAIRPRWVPKARIRSSAPTAKTF